jgi:hypothetical protein
VLALLVLLVPVAALLLSCGGGGGSSSSGGTGSTGTGSVAVFLADSPADEYENIFIWITEVSLIPQQGDGQRVVIYENHQINDGHEGLKLDLLAYRDEDFLLTLKSNVPSGQYAKIRLGISFIEPVGGGTCASLDVKLPSNRIDLNPRSPFRVVSGGALAIRLDIDANKSINLHPAGNSGKCIFRPVVFVDIEEAAQVARCPRILSGTIDRLLTSADGTQTVGFILTLPDNRGDLEVHLSSQTRIFDADGEFTDASALAVGQKVKVRGRVNAEGVLEASVVVIGQVLEVRGQVNGAVDNNGLFLFTPIDGEELVGQRNVRVTDQTLILVDCDTEVPSSAIQDGMNALVIGKDVSGVLNAVAILIKPQVTGEITTIMDVTSPSPGKSVTITKVDSTQVTVFVPTDTPVYLGGDGALTIEDLCVGQDVRVALNANIPSPLTALTVLVESVPLAGTVTDVSGSTLTVGGQTVDVQQGAIVIDQRTGEDTVGDLSNIMAGDQVTCFGLWPCSGGNFEAFVIVITG